MSRSRKKHPITGVCICRSEKPWKQIANRTLRRHHKWAVRKGEVLPLMREVSNIYTWGKDGKHDWTGSEYEKKARRK